MTVALIVLLPLIFMITSFVNAISPGMCGVSLKVDEDLSNYFEALEEPDKKAYDNGRRKRS